MRPGPITSPRVSGSPPPKPRPERRHGQLFPTLHVDADWGAIGQTLSTAHETYRMAATLRVPVFEGGRATARRIQASAELKRTQAELEDFRGRVEYDVRSALLDLTASSQQLQAAQTTVTLAGQELEQARDRFAAGVAGNLEVTQAQEAVAIASESYISALYANDLAKATLAQASRHRGSIGQRISRRIAVMSPVEEIDTR